MELKNKTTIITGGGRGIGKAIAIAFAQEGSNLVLAARTVNELESVKQQVQKLTSTEVEIFNVDVASESNVQQLVDFTLNRFGDINVLVNCAGIYGPIGMILDIDLQEWIDALHINLVGTLTTIKYTLPTMINNGYGKIINLSGGGAVSPLPRFSAYSASKAAVVRLTETLAYEVAEFNIDINAIAPGAVNTKLLDQVLSVGEAAGKDFLIKAKKQKLEGGVPPEKAAELAVFLASSKSDGLTGRIISAVWDNWNSIPDHLTELMSSDIYTMRRIIPKDREYDGRMR